MSIPITLLWNAPSANFIGLLQSRLNAGPMVLTNPTGVSIPNFARTVSFTSAFNNSAMAFTIVGKDIYGNVITEAPIAGPNANTVESVNSYNFITSITASAAFTSVSVGTGTGGQSIWVVLNPLNVGAQTSLNATVTGTVAYSVVRTPIDVNKYPFPAPANVYTYPVVAALTAATTNQAYEMTIPSMGVQLQMAQGAGNTGTVAFTVLQQGVC